jgi:diaminobutyrate-2-oxoglutarate transaminase
MVEDAQPYLERQQHRESAARSYPRRLPIVPSHADGMVVTTIDGRRFLDCLSGAGTLALGHNHRVATEAMVALLSSGAPLHMLDLPTPVKDRFTTALLDSLPPSFASQARVQFCGPTGADAVEAALKLVKTATGRRTILAFRGAYHGMTHGALGLTGETAPKERVAGLLSDVHFLPFPSSYRCPFGIGGVESAEVGIRYLIDLLDDSQSGVCLPAAVIVEAVQGEGGTRPAPDRWLRELRRITAERNIPLVLDEVQTGLGRTGAMWAFEHAGITPDVVCMSKAIGGGQPLAVVVYRETLDTWAPGAHAGTFRGNQLAMAAGAATIDFVRERRLDHRAVIAGDRLRRHLEALQRDHDCIGDVRGRGLMLGVEIVNPAAGRDASGTPPVAPERARQIQAECLARGLIVETGGRAGSVVRFLPPLIASDEQLDSVADRFSGAVSAVQNQMFPVKELIA